MVKIVKSPLIYVCIYKSTRWDDDSIAPNQTLPHIYSLDRLKPYLKSDP
jgi:hypothetical protein